MATNYSIMKESQKELLNDFKKFYLKVIDNQNLLLNQIRNTDMTYESILQQTVFLENQINLIYTDILDECMWIIQKDSPRAGHLRFIIATINSIKDLERISDHAEMIAQYLLENNYNKEELRNFLDGFSDTNQLLTTLFNFFNENKYSQEVVDEILTMRNKVLTKLNYLLIDQLKTINHQNLNDKKYSDLVLMFRHIERNVEHGINIIQNFGNIHISSK
ncbi:PhoU domain-containing protein [Ureaplasma canigenitalium]|uniref:PhoU domain-containing protein n=1 Tax=Ureaplasma canigenitalium TaxID=42092 RepID=UPI0004E1B395|nr:PhoU domain-containing protein [Ureaplasma canigenitalium]